MKAVKTNVKFEKENKQKPPDTISIVYFYKTACLHRFFDGRLLSIRVFFADGHYDSVAPRTNTIASRDQLKPIRIGENLVANYKGW